MFKDIRAALVSHLMTYTPLPNIAYENASYEPDGSQYVMENTLWGDAVNLTLNASHEQQTGIYQLSIFSPINTGTLDDLELTGGLKSHFKAGTRLTYNGVRIEIYRVQSGPMSIDGSYMMRPLSIYFKYLGKVV